MRYFVIVILISICYACKRHGAQKLKLSELASLQTIEFSDSNYYSLRYILSGREYFPESEKLKDLDNLYLEIKSWIYGKKNLESVLLLVNKYKGEAKFFCKQDSLKNKVAKFSVDNVDTTSQSEIIYKIRELHNLHVSLLEEIKIRITLRCQSSKMFNPLEAKIVQDSSSLAVLRVSMPDYSPCLFGEINLDTVYYEGKLSLGMLKFKKANSLFDLELLNLPKGDNELNGIYYYNMGFRHKKMGFKLHFNKR